MSGGTERPACRACGAPLAKTFLDLGELPSPNALLDEADLARPERVYPLHIWVCGTCFLVQSDATVAPEELFSDYPYFSSYSDSWVEHARRFAAAAARRFGLGSRSLVVEVGSNDGYLLKHFRDKGVPVLGVEPAANVAEAAIAEGVPTEVRFFGLDSACDLSARGLAADLLVGINVLAHVPDLNDFVAGLKTLLKPDGTVVAEFPHLLRLITEVQFDTIYHEHFSYFSLLAVERALDAHGLEVFDVERLSTHGGSLRIYASHRDRRLEPATGRLAELRAEEKAAGLDRLAAYEGFAERVQALVAGFTDFLDEAKAAGKRVAGYGAAAKASMLLNVARVGPELVDYVVDRSPHKQGRFMPGSRIPIVAPERVAETRPDYLLVLAWNLEDEIVAQMGHLRSWGGRFVLPVPKVVVLP